MGASISKRNLSESVVLRELAACMPATVPELAERLSISPSTLFKIISRLESKHLLCQAGTVDSASPGRKRIRYQLQLPGPVLSCQFVDSCLAGALFDSSLDAVAMAEGIDASRIRTLPEAAQALSDLRNRLLSEAGLPDRNLYGIAIGLHGVQLVNDRVINHTALDWAEETMAVDLAETLGHRVKLYSPSGLYAEYRERPFPQPASMSVLRIGDGISAHSLYHGQLQRGHSGFSGELGHIVLKPDGPLCACGSRGCLEAVCSGRAIHRQMLNELAQGARSSLSHEQLSAATSREALDLIWRAWREDDDYVRSFMGMMFDAIGWGVSIICNIHDPELLLFGGYVVQDRQQWLDEIIRHTRHWIFNPEKRHTVYGLCAASATGILKETACSLHQAFAD